MRIAMVCGSYPPQPCGIGDYTERLVSELIRSGVDIEVITSASPDRALQETIRFQLDNWSGGAWLRTVGEMKKRQYDIVHFQYPARFYGYRPSLGSLSLILRMRLPSVPIVLTLHEFRITHFLRKLTVAAIAAPASAILLTADSERVALERWMPWLRKKVHVVNMATTIPVIPLSSERRTELRSRYGVKPEEKLVVYFGLLHPNKGIEKLMRTFQLLHARNPSTKLLMLSLFEPFSNQYHAGIRTGVASLGIEEAVIWAGFLPPADVSEHLASADAGIFPFEDGVTLRRLSFMTAMSHGLPVLTTVGHAGSEDLGLRHGENVLLVDAADSPDRMAAALDELFSSEEMMVRLSAGARTWSSGFQWGSVVTATKDIYTTIVAGISK